tara:strand:- start:2707 stop:2880 length:174 start_codon:yes stop_codon:yes gene_type:complete
LALEKIINVEALLEETGYGGKLVAVARNGEFIPKESYADITLKDNDKIEIVAPMQGG